MSAVAPVDASADKLLPQQALEAHDSLYLCQAIALSITAKQRGNRPFGSVIVSAAGEIQAQAWNASAETGDCTAHAETAAIRLASAQFSREELAGSTIYASGEPCVMCEGAIFWLNIGRVVYGIDAVRLRAFRGARHDQTDLELSCREVFASSSRAIECLGPALLDETSAVHQQAWKASP